MTEFWRWAITAGVSVNLFVLGLILKLMFDLKREVKSMLDGFKIDTEKKITKICDDDRDAHSQLWERIYHHSHTEKGEVVITE